MDVGKSLALHSLMPSSGARHALQPTASDHRMAVALPALASWRILGMDCGVRQRKLAEIVKIDLEMGRFSVISSVASLGIGHTINENFVC